MRIRTIKPEFWRNRKLAALGIEAHDFAARLISASDDEGYFELDPAILAGDLYPHTPNAQKLVAKNLPLVEAAGFIERRGGEYGIGRLPTWREHQVISHPAKSRLRPKFDGFQNPPEPSVNPPESSGGLLEPSGFLQTEQGTGNREVEQGKGTGNATSLLPAPSDLQHTWNTEADPTLPRCHKLTDGREKHSKARLAEHGLPKLRQVIAGINASDFLCGRNGHGPWVADYDFFIKPDTPIRVLEGKYANREKSTPSRNEPVVYREGRTHL